MYEVEVKVAAEHEAIRERLPEEAEALGAVEQVDTYYDAPHRAFAETDEALRLRRERTIASGHAAAETEEFEPGEWTTAVTYKGPLLEAESKSREEFETEVVDGEELASALDRLGFEPAAEVRKERERYALGECTISLDTVEGLGEFLEVETEVAETAGTSAADAIAEPRETARSLVADLGGDPDEQIRTSYLGLLLEEESN